MFSDGLVWPLSERIGNALQLGPATIGVILGTTSLVGALASMLAGKLGTRWGLTLPLLGAAWTSGLGGLVLTHAHGVGVYVLGAIVKTIGLLFFLPYLMETAAELDRRGRVSAIAGGMIPLGAALGPFVAGTMVERWGFGAAGWAGVGVVSMATLLLARVVVVASHRAKP
jgi:MFS family permease